ncbi:hypothetical protein DSAG12_01751 [Promethearchaeum syntrophicum]|uniref:Uncharacterized protein n=1 Tax=Promethearchaeum syntrophicum TaxID=2594042 RepID=A0A5B9D9V7_9ARCH|nr:hypothetical protein [Candidatus Prometheoarchaeum syntrophicum]QEE15924.1 hypothetical protein DSAG12_01751 [Candidatus Prometheoarchaeum syntrophicum]
MPRAHSEKNEPNQKEILGKIAQIKEMNSNFLNLIGKLEYIPRDKLVELDYLKKCEKHAPWLEKSLKLKNKNGEIIEENEMEDILSDRQNLLKKLLVNIESSPKKRNQFIKQFLEQNSLIEKADREILIKSYESLSSEKLEKELNNILEIFGK